MYEQSFFVTSNQACHLEGRSRCPVARVVLNPVIELLAFLLSVLGCEVATADANPCCENMESDIRLKTAALASERRI